MPSVFILDDDASLLLALDIWLSRSGYKVYTFNNSADLIHAFFTFTPDIILLDIMLSELKDGKSVCLELKHQYHYPNKIYLFSATHVQDNDLLNCGADGFIDKPFDLQDFLETLNRALLKVTQ
jgi:DNA-binding response OmpR family regulator